VGVFVIDRVGVADPLTDLLKEGEGVSVRLSLGGLYEYTVLSDTDADGLREGDKELLADADTLADGLGDAVILAVIDGDREFVGESLIVGEGDIDAEVLAEGDIDAETDADTEVEADTDADVDADAEVLGELVADLVADADADVVADADADVVADTDVDGDPVLDILGLTEGLAEVEGVLVGVGDGTGAHSAPFTVPSSQMLNARTPACDCQVARRAVVDALHAYGHSASQNMSPSWPTSRRHPTLRAVPPGFLGESVSQYPSSVVKYVPTDPVSRMRPSGPLPTRGPTVAAAVRRVEPTCDPPASL
jgi:hypothetical protein